jgi:hypothetical protein
MVRGNKINDIIVSSKKYVASTCPKMYDQGSSNEFAIKFFKIKENDFYVHVISHQWPSGYDDLLFASIDGYLKGHL